MKIARKFAGALLALFSITCAATTFVPIQLLNPSGSTSGQAIVSTGSSTASAWANVSATSLAAQAANTVVANVTGSSASPTAFAMPSCSGVTSALQYTSGTGFTCYTSSASTTGATFTGNIAFSYPTAATQLGIVWQNNGSTRWLFQNDGVAESGSNAGSNLILGRFSDTGTFLATALTITRSSGLLTSSGGIATTTLSASSTVSGTGFSSYLASPPAIGGTAAAAGSFTTLSASGLITPSSTVGIKGTSTNDDAQAGSNGEYPTPGSNTGTSLTTGVTANATSMSLTAGDWDVECSVRFNPAASTVTSVIFASVNTTSATNGALGSSVQMVNSGFVNGQPQIINTPVTRVKLASSGTAYCPVYASFSTSTMTVDGFIRARRPR